ncbi:LOW QUALITY PROTEIN: mast cell-expressed membrane protein 1 [Dugong dugon]
MSWQARHHGAEEIYMNQEVKMQAADSKDKKQGGLAKNKGSDPWEDPDYENITLTFRNQHQPKGGHSPPMSQVPAQSRPLSAPAQIPHWLYRAIMSLYILLVLTFVFFIILSAMVLLKISNSMRESQKEQKKSQSHVQQAISQIKMTINTVDTNVQKENVKLDTLKKELNQVKVELEKKMETILKPPEKKQNPREFGLEEASKAPDRGKKRGPTHGDENGHARPHATATRIKARAPLARPSLRRACVLTAFYGAVKQLGRAEGPSYRPTHVVKEALFVRDKLVLPEDAGLGGLPHVDSNHIGC